MSAPTAVRSRRPATAITIRPAPRREPPFDDELPSLHGAGPHDQRLPLARRAANPGQRPAPPRPDHLPDPSRWAHSLLIGVIETAAGRRPLQQLAALFSLPVASGLGADFERAALLHKPHWTHAASVRTIHASRPSDGVAELSATLQTGTRVRAVALRLEAHSGRWRCTRLQLG
jgi:hypothetical protein